RERGDCFSIRPEHGGGQVEDTRRLSARHHFVAADADLVEPFEEFLWQLRLLVAPRVLGYHHLPLLRRAKGEQNMARTRIEQADMGTDADGYAPIARRFLLGDNDGGTAIENDELVCLA